MMERRQRTDNREQRSRSDGRERDERRLRMRREDYKPRRMPPRQEKKEKTKFNFKLFGRWDSNVEVEDIGLRDYINVDAKYIPRSAGVHRGRFHKSKMHIVERLALNMMVPGHQGRRHRLTSGKFCGSWSTVLGNIEKTFEIIEKREKRNPLEIIIEAISNAAPREEIISYQLGSIMAREAVITAPQRRIDKTLRMFAQSAYRKTFNKKKKIYESLADELIAAAKNSSDSFAIKERDRIEKEASGAR
jgi:small subunit ribosomal protein S7